MSNGMCTLHKTCFQSVFVHPSFLFRMGKHKKVKCAVEFEPNEYNARGKTSKETTLSNFFSLKKSAKPTTQQPSSMSVGEDSILPASLIEGMCDLELI